MAMSSTGLIMTAALIAGGVGAGAALMVGNPVTPAPSSPANTADLQEALAEREREIDELRGALDELRASVGRLEAAPPAEATPAGDPSAQPGADADEGVSSDPSPVTADQARFETMYREMRRKEESEEAERRLRNEAESLRRRLERTGERLSIPAEHHESIVRILTDRSRRTREAMRSARNSDDESVRAAARETATSIREETRLQLEAFLTAEQITSLERGAGARTGGRMNGGGRRANGNGNGGGRRPGGNGNR